MSCTHQTNDDQHERVSHHNTTTYNEQALDGRTFFTSSCSVLTTGSGFTRLWLVLLLVVGIGRLHVPGACVCDDDDDEVVVVVCKREGADEGVGRAQSNAHTGTITRGQHALVWWSAGTWPSPSRRTEGQTPAHRPTQTHTHQHTRKSKARQTSIAPPKTDERGKGLCAPAGQHHRHRRHHQ
jgi:hypothetical protein